MAREPPSLSPTRTRTERAQLLPRHSGRGRAKRSRAWRARSLSHAARDGPWPAMLVWQQAAPGGRWATQRPHLPTLLCRRRRSTSCAPPAVPSWPRRPDHRQAVWLGGLLPMGGDAQRNRAWPYVEGAVAHPPGPMTGHGAAYRLPQPTGATRSGGAVMLVSASRSITGRLRPARPRWSPLWPAARGAHGVPAPPAVGATRGPGAPWPVPPGAGRPGGAGHRAGMDSTTARSTRAQGSPRAVGRPPAPPGAGYREGRAPVGDARGVAPPPAARAAPASDARRRGGASGRPCAA
jgi:hypothetical protein